MKKDFLWDIQGIDVKLLFGFMKGFTEFEKLDIEDQRILIWSVLKHPNTINMLLDSWSEDYRERDICINTPELLNDIQEAIIFLDSAPKRIRYILNSPDRQKIFESITDFERGAFSLFDLQDHLIERGFIISDANINMLLRALSHHRFLSEDKIGRVTYYQRT